MGVRVSTEADFVLLDRGLIGKIGSEVAPAAAVIEPETYDAADADEDPLPPEPIEDDQPANDAELDAPVIRPRETAGSTRSFWSPVAVGGVAVLFGLLLASLAWAVR